MIRYRRRLNEGSLNRYEKRNIIDGEYLVNNCQDFGASDSVRNLYADLRAMLKNSDRVKTPDEALYLLQSIRNTCEELSKTAQNIIDQGSRA